MRCDAMRCVASKMSRFKSVSTSYLSWVATKDLQILPLVRAWALLDITQWTGSPALKHDLPFACGSRLLSLLLLRCLSSALLCRAHEGIHLPSARLPQSVFSLTYPEHHHHDSHLNSVRRCLEIAYMSSPLPLPQIHSGPTIASHKDGRNFSPASVQRVRLLRTRSRPGHQTKKLFVLAHRHHRALSLLNRKSAMAPQKSPEVYLSTAGYPNIFTLQNEKKLVVSPVLRKESILGLLVSLPERSHTHQKIHMHRRARARSLTMTT